MDYKEELIKRVIFLLDNYIYLIKPIKYQYLLDLYFYLEENESNLLQNIESLLLSDKPLEENNIYQKVALLKKDKYYLYYLKDNKDYIIDAFTILAIIRKYIERERIDYDVLTKKMQVMDEYFKIIRYQNNKFTYISGADLVPGDILNHIKIVSGIIKGNFYDRKKINYSRIRDSHFMDFIIDKKNYHENSSILTEEEKQKIYLMFHDEIPWNMKNICQKSDLFFSDNYCNNDYYVKEEDIFYYNGKYYMMCPNCFNIAIVNIENIPKTILDKIKNSSLKDHNILRKAFYEREYFINKKEKQLLKK